MMESIESKNLGFDIIEIAENNIELDIDKKKKIVSTILSNGLNFHWKVGRKDPRHQPLMIHYPKLTRQYLR
jgi:phosphosulfolactate synthase